MNIDYRLMINYQARTGARRFALRLVRDPVLVRDLHQVAHFLAPARAAHQLHHHGLRLSCMQGRVESWCFHYQEYLCVNIYKYCTYSNKQILPFNPLSELVGGR